MAGTKVGTMKRVIESRCSSQNAPDQVSTSAGQPVRGLDVVPLIGRIL